MDDSLWRLAEDLEMAGVRRAIDDRIERPDPLLVAVADALEGLLRAMAKRGGSHNG